MSEGRLRVLVVDDEPIARRGLLRLLAPHDDLTLVGECSDGRSALEALESHRPDLVFLDVQMPELDGFEVLREFGPERAPAVIFVTAFDDFAVRAFEVHALDYLVKPFSDERFEAALARARRALRQAQAAELGRRLARLLDDMPADGAAKAPARGEAAPRAGEGGRLRVPVGNRELFVPVSEIDWVEASDYYVSVHVGQKSHLLRETLASIESRLGPERFVRIHRSALVNVDRVVEIERASRVEAYAVLADGTRLRIGRARRDELARRLLAAQKAPRRLPLHRPGRAARSPRRPIAPPPRARRRSLRRPGRAAGCSPRAARCKGRAGGPSGRRLWGERHPNPPGVAPMIHRVEYLVALLLAGAALGFAAGTKRGGPSPARLARAYFAAYASIAALRAALLAAAALVTFTPPFVRWPLSAAGDASNLLLGSLFGLALALRRRGDAATGGPGALERFAKEPALLQGLCLSAGVDFVLVGLAKTMGENFEMMTKFFHDSGYSTPFLSFVIVTEVLGGVGLLVPLTVVPAAACLEVFMFGAVFTHVNNNDPVHDNVSAFAVTLRLGTIALLALLRPRGASAPAADPADPAAPPREAPRSPLRRPLALVAAACALAALFAAFGARTVARAGAPPAALQRETPPPDAARLAAFAGAWQCEGRMSSDGHTFRADIAIKPEFGGAAYSLRHEDGVSAQHRHAFQALGSWRHDAAGRRFIYNVIDASVAPRTFTSAGPEGEAITWQSDDETARRTGGASRFIFRKDGGRLVMIYERAKGEQAWHEVDRLVCSQAGA